MSVVSFQLGVSLIYEPIYDCIPVLYNKPNTKIVNILTSIWVLQPLISGQKCFFQNIS